MQILRRRIINKYNDICVGDHITIMVNKNNKDEDSKDEDENDKDESKDKKVGNRDA